MCVVSMVMDRAITDMDKWYQPLAVPQVPYDYEALKERVAQLEKQMEMAAELDAFLKQPDCESALKKAKLQFLADKLGVKIKFPKEA